MLSLVRWPAIRFNGSTTLASLHRAFFSSPASAANASSADIQDASSMSKVVNGARGEDKLGDFTRLLSSKTLPHSRVWSSYANDLGISPSLIPLEIHQMVLRSCVPPLGRQRTQLALRMQSGHKVNRFHLYEARLQRVIRNIRLAGFEPALQDYHFILSQFAAVAHHKGALQVLREMRAVGRPPDQRAYTSCLEAITYRLSLPCYKHLRRQLQEECTQLAMQLMHQMRSEGHHPSSRNVDLALRILKDSSNPTRFEDLLRTAYGIDLSYPDRLPIEYVEGKSVLHPFSTSALNTSVDYYGRQRNLSRMVQVFEVLSKPLPTLSSPTNMAMDDDDDDYLSPTSIGQILPFAHANTTTYNLLIRHCARLEHYVLARHYAIEAEHEDRRLSRILRKEARTKPHSDINHPLIQVGRLTLLPLLGYGNRAGRFGAVHWVLRRAYQYRQYKRDEGRYYRKLHRKMLRQSQIQSNPVPPADPGQQTFRDPLDPTPTDDFFSSYTPGSIGAQMRIIRKPFDIERHIRILERDLSIINQFLDEVKKTHQRIERRERHRHLRRFEKGKRNMPMRLLTARVKNMESTTVAAPSTSNAPTTPTRGGKLAQTSQLPQSSTTPQGAS